MFTQASLPAIYSGKNDLFSFEAVFSVYQVMLQPSVKNVNTLPNQNTEFDKRSVSKQEHKHAKPLG